MSEKSKLTRRSFLRASAMTMAAAKFGQTAFARSGRGARGQLFALDGATVWLNSQPLTAGALQGKVVLVDFWTYSCINWRRPLPYVRAWAGKYKDRGLMVVGVHTPEFSFEKNVDNVRWATKDMRIDYPVVIDNDRAIWRAFNNEYWPALYFVDARGSTRHHVFGEGEYKQSEALIQQLLIEAGVKDIDKNWFRLMPGVPKPPPIGANWGPERTTSDRSAPRTLPGTAAKNWTSVMNTQCPLN